MNFRARIFKKISSYEDWVANEVSTLQIKFPNVTVKSFTVFNRFLTLIIPKLIHKYILLSGAMKVCSTISPDFAEIACANGFPVLIEHTPGHVRNIVITSDGPYIIDLSYIQFLCKNDLLNKDERQQALIAYKDIYNNPFKAIKVEKLPLNELPHVTQPTGNYEDKIYDPVQSINNYDIKDTEETFPERFLKYK